MAAESLAEASRCAPKVTFRRHEPVGGDVIVARVRRFCLDGEVTSRLREVAAHLGATERSIDDFELIGQPPFIECTVGRGKAELTNSCRVFALVGEISPALDAGIRQARYQGKDQQAGQGTYRRR